MITITAKWGRCEVSATIRPAAPLGWRFWTLAGFPGNPVEPRPYGGSRCLPLTQIDVDSHARWLCAIELDRSLRLLFSHGLFPCADQDGAEAFAREIIERHT